MRLCLCFCPYRGCAIDGAEICIAVEGDSTGDSTGDSAICGAGSADSLMDWDASCAVVRSAGVCFAMFIWMLSTCKHMT